MSKRGARTPGYWYDNTPIPLPARMLAPVYGAVTAMRRSLYRRGWLKRHGVPVPVVVIGNVTAGGTGKTPLTITLVSRLQQAGWTRVSPAVVMAAMTPGLRAGSMRTRQ